VIKERLAHIAKFRIDRAQSLSPGAARTLDLLVAQMAYAAREGVYCSVYAPGIDWPAPEDGAPETRR